MQIEQMNRVAARGTKFRDLTSNEIVQSSAVPGFLAVAEPDSASAGSLDDYFVRHEAELRRELASRGGLLFRGFNVDTAEDFERALRAFGLDLAVDYSFGMTKRTQMGDRVFSSTDFSRHLMIPPHTEMSYSHRRPGWISFFCLQAPGRYGETPCFDMAGVLQHLSGDLRNRLERKVSYIRRIPPKHSLIGQERTILETFGTEDRKQIRSQAAELGTETHWTDDGILETTTILSPITRHPSTGAPCLNAIFTDLAAQAILFERFAGRYGPAERLLIKSLLRLANRTKLARAYETRVDGEPLSEAELRQLFDALFENAVIFHWRQGDVLLLDNIRTGHGRLPFHGKRRIMACFGDMYDLRDGQTPDAGTH